MRISDLSRQTGVPIATIKFYLREGLLPPGRPTGRNQARYDATHCRRLRLIRAFTNIGQLDLSSVRELLAAIENDQLPLPGLYDVVNQTIHSGVSRIDGIGEIWQTHADVDKLIEDLGWQVASDASGRSQLIRVLTALRQLGCEYGIDFFTPYAQAAEQLAVQELDLLNDDGLGADRAAAVARAVLLDVAFVALRRMALDHHVTLRFDQGSVDPQS